MGLTVTAWTGLHVTAIGLVSGIVVGIVTGSRLTAAGTTAAVVVCYPAGVWMGSVWAPRSALFTLEGVWLVLLSAVLGWWVVRERRAMKPVWACQACGYDRRGIGADRECPECGATAGRQCHGRDVL